MNSHCLKTFFYKNITKKLMFTGLLLACLAMLPYCILGTGSIVTYHDQLDGELMSYILTAKYLFTGITIYPEIMDGLPANGAVPPAPAFVLLYKVFRPFIAFMISQWLINIIAFTGMYLLLNKVSHMRHPKVSFLISIIFMLLPFYTVYGLCIPGQPYVCLAYLSLATQTSMFSEKVRKGKVFSVPKLMAYFIIILYGLCSSLTLVGFACLLAVLTFGIAITGLHLTKKKEVFPVPVIIGFFFLLLSYLATNFSLILQVLFPSTGYVSHKTEYVISPENFISSFRTALFQGISYAQSYPTILLAFVVILLLISILLHILHCKLPASLHYILLLAAIIVLISFWYAFYHGTFMTDFRNQAGGIWLEFNLDRVAWLLPTCWCLLAIYCFDYLLALFQQLSSGKFKILLKKGSRILVLLILMLWGGQVLLQSSIKPNIAKIVKLATGREYYALDWDNFFASDIFSQINEAIGKPQDSYHVISIGIYPVAAAYNGFYCLDGYSNNYPLSYKHTFRKIIAGELAKSDYITALFDDWGNRCYVTTAEQNNYYTFEKKWNSVIYDLDLNIEQLQEMNCQYIFSAAYLLNADDMGLTLLQDAPFETDGSWYHIYVYVVPEP